MADQRHVFSIEVEDKPGVMARISTPFSRRGFNVESLTVGKTHIPGRSRFTIVSSGDENTLEQIRKQAQKLVHVITTDVVTDDKELFTESKRQWKAKNEKQTLPKFKHAVTRELAIVKVAYDEGTVDIINHIVETFFRPLAPLGNRFSLVLEFSGQEGKIERVFQELGAVQILESVRTGKVAIGIDEV